MITRSLGVSSESLGQPQCWAHSRDELTIRLTHSLGSLTVLGPSQAWVSSQSGRGPCPRYLLKKQSERIFDCPLNNKQRGQGPLPDCETFPPARLPTCLHQPTPLSTSITESGQLYVFQLLTSKSRARSGELAAKPIRETLHEAYFHQPFLCSSNPDVGRIGPVANA